MSAATTTPEAVMPTRRDLRFGLPAERIGDWNGNGEHLSLFMNTLSLFFPVGERFFIDSVRHYRDRITDPELQRAVTAFIGQEAMHGREHQEYNEALFAAVPEARAMERKVARLLAFFQRRMPQSMQLSATIALEHFTAIMADGLLKEPRVLEGSEPRYAALWNWHALEETEHKAVAFDVWESVMGRGARAEAERRLGLLAASVILWILVARFYLTIVRKQGKLGDVAGWRRCLRVMFGEIGYFRKLAKPWADYFKPGFHPWHHDNRHFLARVDGLAAGIQAATA